MALYRATKWYQRSKVCRWTFLRYILVTQTASLPHTFSYILSTNCAAHLHTISSYWWHSTVTALRNGRSGVRIPGRARDFSLHNAKTGTENLNVYRDWFQGARRPRCEVTNSQTSTDEINKDWNYISKPPTCLDGWTDRHDAANSRLVALHMYSTCRDLVWKPMSIIYLFNCRKTVRFKQICH